MYYRSTCMYINNDYDLRSLSKQGLLRISRIQYGPMLVPYGKINNSMSLSYVLRITAKSMQLFNSSHNRYLKNNIKTSFIAHVYNKQVVLPDPKISATHIRHITINELNAIPLGDIMAKCHFLDKFFSSLSYHDLSTTAFCGIIIWILGLDDVYYNLISKSSIWYARYSGLVDFATTVKKEVTLKLKAVQNLCGLDLTPFFEFEVLINRGLGEIDWKQERINRTECNLVNITPDLIFSRSVNLFTKTKRRGGRPFKEHFTNFWKMRWQWSPPGAYYSQYEVDDKYRAKDPMLRNKLYAYNAMETRTFDYFLNRKPETRAKASVKYEWGKQRAIYSVDSTNFIISSFAMNGCEEALASVTPIAQEAESSRVAHTVRNVLSNGVPYCFDFEDFNSQHSVGAMQAVLRAYAQVYKHDLSEEQLAGIGWLIVSLENIYIIGKDGITYKANGTLLSGWRLTTFMNTVLNIVYTEIATSYKPFVTTHSGDDILGAVTNMTQIQNMEKHASIYNIRFQSNKCYVGAISEFLRVDHTDGNGSQYLARSISTLVHGPTEMAIPNDPGAIIKAITTRASEAKSRKMKIDILNPLVEAQYTYTEKKWSLQTGIGKILCHTHVSRGGMSTEITEESLSNYIKRVTLRKKEPPDGYETDQILPGMIDFTNWICAKYGLQEYHNKILDSTKHAVFDRALSHEFGLICEKTINIQPSDWLRAAQYGMYKPLFKSNRVGLAKTYNIPLHTVKGEFDILTNILLECKDPLTAATLWM